MPKRITCSLMLLLLFVSVLAINSGVTLAHHDPHNPNHLIKVTNIIPNGFYPGLVMAVEGGPFEPYEDGLGSVVVFDGDEVLTFFETPSRLVYVVPLDATCSNNHHMFVRTYKGTQEHHEAVETEPMDVIVTCTEFLPYGPRPIIEEIEYSDNVTAGRERIHVKGIDILPYNSGDGYPHTLVHYTMGSVVGTTELTYHRYGEVSFTLDVHRCGTYRVTLRNYYISDRNYTESSAYRIDVTNGCDDVPPIQGDYELALLDMPEQAEVGVEYDATLEVGFTAPYEVEEELEVYVNGQLQDSWSITVNAHAITEYPVKVHFDKPGTNTVEVRLAGESAQATVEVRGAGDPAGATPSPAPPQQYSGQLTEFDTNGDCLINESEYILLTDAWLAEQISEELFFTGTDAWIEERNICTSSASTRPLRVQQNSRAIMFSSSANLSSMVVQIFDANGRMIDAMNAQGNRLSWSMRDRQGARVANGVYFARVAQYAPHGAVTHDLKKIVVMR